MEISSQATRRRLSRAFEDREYHTRTAENYDQAVEQARSESPEFAVVDLKMPGRSGLELVQSLHEIDPMTKVVVLTGYGSIATAVKATKLGATSYFTKPVDIDEVERAFHTEEGDADDGIPIPDEFPSLYRHEREYIEYVLAECEGNISQAARRLGLHRQSLQRKLRKFSPN